MLRAADDDGAREMDISVTWGWKKQGGHETKSGRRALWQQEGRVAPGRCRRILNPGARL